MPKKCHSMINPPLFIGDDDIFVISKWAVPELHIIQGSVNHLFSDRLVNLICEYKALKWLKSLNISSKNYHRQLFKDNGCRKILWQSNRLMESSIYEEVDIFGIVLFVSVSREINALVVSCFLEHTFDKLASRK